MFEFILGGLQIHGQGNDTFYLNTPIEGLESPELRIGSYDKPGEDGSVVSSALYGGRAVTLTGKVSGSNPIQFEQNRQALVRACAIQRDVDGYPVPVKCAVTLLSGATYFFMAHVGKPKFNYDAINWSNFMLPLIVPEPQIYGTSLIDSGAVLLPQANGATWPVTWPLTWGGQTGGSVTVTNSGSIFVWPIITLVGPLTNPYVINSTTGKVMQLSYTLAAGNFIRIYMGDTVDPNGQRQLGKRIMLNDIDSLIATKTSESEWWAIEPGDNVIGFSSAGGSDTGTFQATFNPGFIGV